MGRTGLARTIRAVAPKRKEELAREHLASAQDDLAAGREKETINALFYAADAAVVALADANAIETKQSHRLKADAATELHARGLIEDDFGPLIKQLNQARKNAWYDGEEPELGQSLEDTVNDVETLVAAAGASQ